MLMMWVIAAGRIPYTIWPPDPSHTIYQPISYRLQVTSYQLQVISYNPTTHKLPVTSLQVTRL
jgi:hypothetical protein